MPEDTLNDRWHRVARERESLGRGLVTSAANGDVYTCRLILERERLIKASKDLFKEPIELTNASTTRPITTDRNQLSSHSSAFEEIVLTNFVSSGHTSLQAASQNGHVEVCRVLIGEFGADVEFQVLNYFKLYIFLIMDLLSNIVTHLDAL